MNLILIPFILLITINCEPEKKITKPDFLSFEKSKVIEKYNYNDYLISDTLKITNSSLIINLKESHFSYRSFNKNKKVDKSIHEKQFNDSIVEHKFLTFYSSKQDSVRFFLREKIFPTMLNSKIISDYLVYDSPIQIGMSKKEFIKVLKNIYHLEKDIYVNKVDYSIDELKKILKIYSLPRVLVISDSFYSCSFIFSFENDILDSIEYQVYYWE